MNVQHEVNQKVRDEIKVWYDQVYPNMEEVIEETTLPMYYVNGRKMEEASFIAMKQAVYANYDIEYKEVTHRIEKGSYAVQSYQIVMKDQKTKQAIKKCVKQWHCYKDHTKTELKEVWIFVYENDQR